MTENPKINSNKASEVASEGLTQHELDTCEEPVEKSEELTRISHRVLAKSGPSWHN